MPQVIKSPETKIITKNGENILSITVEPIVIEIVLNVQTDGSVSMASTTTKKQEPVEEKIDWVVPDFGSQMVKFGKRVGE